MSVVSAPLVLIFSLPGCADAICDFVRVTTMEVPGVGDVCGFGCFDFTKFGDENWGGQIPGVGEMGKSFARRAARPKAKLGKMEKSFFGFKNNNSSWAPEESGQDLIDKVDGYCRAHAAEAERERRLHVEAAVKMLRNLEELEGAGGAGGRGVAGDLRRSVVGAANKTFVDRISGEYLARGSVQPGEGRGVPTGGDVSHTGDTDAGVAAELQNILHRSTVDDYFHAASDLDRSAVSGLEQSHLETKAVAQYMQLDLYHSTISHHNNLK